MSYFVLPLDGFLVAQGPLQPPPKRSNPLPPPPPPSYPPPPTPCQQQPSFNALVGMLGPPPVHPKPRPSPAGPVPIPPPPPRPHAFERDEPIDSCPIARRAVALSEIRGSDNSGYHDGEIPPGPTPQPEPTRPKTPEPAEIQAQMSDRTVFSNIGLFDCPDDMAFHHAGTALTVC